jgi:type IV secretory pathway VirJ component
MRVLRAFPSMWLLAASLLAAIAAAAGAAPRGSDTAPAALQPAPAPAAMPASGTPASDPGRSAGSPESAPGNAIQLNHGRFRDVLVYRPAGAPSSFALLLSGEEGWNSIADRMARQLVQQGAMVAGIDWLKFKASLEADGDQCVFPDGDLENLSHFVQAYFHNPSYLRPILVGISSGASTAYAMLAQAPRNTFAAALTLGFCPNLDMQKPLCKGSGPEFSRNARGHGSELLPIESLANPWVNLQGTDDRACPTVVTRNFISRIRGAAMVVLPKESHDFASLPGWLPQYTAAYDKLATQNPATHVALPPAGLSDLPIVEIPAQNAPSPDAPPTGAATAGTATPGTRPSSAAPAGAAMPGAAPEAARTDTFAIIMSGDGGWAGLDQDVAAALSAKGIPVVGLDSLRYYWTARTPNGLAADTDRIIRYYLAHFGKQRVLLIGYSQGADVLPFAVNRLPEATRARVALTAVMGMSEHALFEFHLSSWISDDNSGPATLPEITRITGIPVLCVYGADESDSLCPKLDPKKFNIVKLKGGHHFDGDYANLAHQILAAAKP